MDKKTFALGGALVAMTFGAVAGTVKARKERIKQEKEFEEIMKIADENLATLEEITEYFKKENERKLEELKVAENSIDNLLNTRKLLDRTNAFLKECEEDGYEEPPE